MSEDRKQALVLDVRFSEILSAHITIVFFLQYKPPKMIFFPHKMTPEKYFLLILFQFTLKKDKYSLSLTETDGLREWWEDPKCGSKKDQKDTYIFVINYLKGAN